MIDALVRPKGKFEDLKKLVKKLYNDFSYVNSDYYMESSNIIFESQNPIAEDLRYYTHINFLSSAGFRFQITISDLTLKQLEELKGV